MALSLSVYAFWRTVLVLEEGSSILSATAGAGLLIQRDDA